MIDDERLTVKSNRQPFVAFCHITLKGKKSVNPANLVELITIGDYLRKVRLDKRLLQKDVAKVFGVSEDTITNWENNQSKPMLKYNNRINSF